MTSVENIPAGSLGQELAEFEDSQENNDNLESLFDTQPTTMTGGDNSQVAVSVSENEQRPSKKQRKERFKFANQKFVATKDLHLNGMCALPFNTKFVDAEEPVLTGQVLKCASAKTDHCFLLTWNKKDTKGADPEWLIDKFHAKNDKKRESLLREAILRCTDSSTQVTQSTSENPSTPVAETLGPNGAPPFHVRAARLANFRTAASASRCDSTTISSLSSGSHGTLGSGSMSDRSTLRSHLRAGNPSIPAAYESVSDEDDEVNDFPPDNVAVRPADVFDEDEDDPQFGDEDEEDNPQDDMDVDEAESLMETVKTLFWKFEDVPDCATRDDKLLDSNLREMHNGPEGLRDGVPQSFSNPFECFAKVGGFDYETVARLVDGTNDYFNRYIKPNLDKNKTHVGMTWKDVQVYEMHRFLGVLLRISMSPVDGGGYEAYFRKSNVVIVPGGGAMELEVDGTAGWAHKHMTLKRFKQTCGAFHPEDKTCALGGDKCYQIRHLIKQFNAASRQSFHIPCWLSFDEGGIGCRSRFCPVRQHNEDKPQKFRVDFFVVCDAKTHATLCLDVCQGKNHPNVGMHGKVRDSPTSQKAVANACCQLGLHKKDDCGGRMRHVAMDNRHQCPQLAVMLREHCNVCTTGTTRSNRKGWPKEELNLTKKMDRGTTKMMHDKGNKVTVAQWVDSKAVNVCSTLNTCDVSTARRQIGSERKEFPCPSMLVTCQKTMGSVDRNDQMRVHGGGFSQKAHFKKWYKKVYLAIMDCMLLNSHIAWNASSERLARSGRRPLKRYEFFNYVAETFLNYEKPQEATQMVHSTAKAATTIIEGIPHIPMKPSKGSRPRCAVCKLEYNWNKSLGEQDLATAVVSCSCCRVSAHNHVILDGNRLIHKRPEFANMTCFDIVHSEPGLHMWPRKEGSKVSFRPNQKHPVILELRHAHRGDKNLEDADNPIDNN